MRIKREIVHAEPCHVQASSPDMAVEDLAGWMWGIDSVAM